MAEFGSAEFFRSLGQYVYAYIVDGDWKYVGKGNGNRGVQHIKTKGYDVKDLYIVARNLERFEDKQDWQSFLLESFAITQFNPSDNSVSGHYKECFVMAKWSELFNDYVDAQYDNFAELPEWYTANYNKLKGRLNVLELKSDVTVVWSTTRDKIQLNFFVDNNGNPYDVKFAIWAKGDALIKKEQELYTFLEACGYSKDNVTKVGKRDFYQIEPESIEEVISILDGFMS